MKMQRMTVQASLGSQAGSAGTRSVRTKAATTGRAAQSERRPHPENVEGSVYVDHTCIDCDTCRWMCPSVYGRVDGQSVVVRQPDSKEDRHQALQALMTCPTFSIHCSDKQPEELKAAAASFPIPVPGTQQAFHCGYSSEASFGSTAYLLVREGGNVLVDSPRYDVKLLKRIQALGGAKYMFLTHRDDVADHVKWASALGCERIIHKQEANREQQTSQCEIKLEGEGPWRLPDQGEDVSLIHTPGHTKGHVVLYHHPEQLLFAGDHMFFRQTGKMGISHYYNWYSVPENLRSVEKLRDLRVRVLLPGHGRRGFFEDAAEQERHWEDLLARDGL